jgi:uncharacterized protein YndB with AHSA1/START domain
MSTDSDLTIDCDAPPQSVWGALTEPDELQSWLADRADVDLADGRYAISGRDVPDVEQRLVDAEAGRRLHLDWEGTEIVISVEADEDVGTIVSVALPDDAPDAVRDFWQRALHALIAYVD